jgi:hypothetical protein
MERRQIKTAIVPMSRDIVKEIAMDIGKDVVAYVEVQYPEAITATSSTFRLSLRNCIYNEIMAALEVVDEDAIRERLAERKRFRRKWKAAYRNIRNQPITEDVINDDL